MVGPRMDTPKTLVESLALERIELNLFRGTSLQSAGRLFGGQVIAQSLLAAYATVEDRLCHSLHCYFIRPGDVRVPILYEVDRARDGGSFTTRRVVAIQHGRQIFNLAASFQVDEVGLEHQADMPSMPDVESLPDDFEEQRKRALEGGSAQLREMMSRPRPIEIRATEPVSRSGAPHEPRTASWMRATAELGPDPRTHQAILAYASDMALLATAMRPHGVNWQTPGLQSASLDHAMWFHRRSDFNRWHLYNQDSPSASGGRGLVRGSIFSQDGRLVASVAQEALIRVRKPEATPRGSDS
jgi:acyl-CoA thioesterase II